MKSEIQKCLDGEIFNISDAEIQEMIGRARELTRKYNQTARPDASKQKQILSELFGGIGNNVNIDTPFFVIMVSTFSLAIM